MDEVQVRTMLEAARREHRELDTEIAAMMADPLVDQLPMARLKKRKLRLKDEIARLEDSLIPDIIA